MTVESLRTRLLALIDEARESLDDRDIADVLKIALDDLADEED